MKSLPSLLYLLLTFYKVISESDSESGLSPQLQASPCRIFRHGMWEIVRLRGRFPSLNQAWRHLLSLCPDQSPTESLDRDRRFNAKAFLLALCETQSPIDEDAIGCCLLCSQLVGKCLQSWTYLCNKTVPTFLLTEAGMSRYLDWGICFPDISL